MSKVLKRFERPIRRVWCLALILAYPSLKRLFDAHLLITSATLFPTLIMPHSHHSHSGQFCRHATGTLEEVVVEAIRKGFEVYGLTEHVPRYRTEDLYPEEVISLSTHLPHLHMTTYKAGMDLQVLRDQFDAFLDEAHRLKVHYAPQITLLVGLETDYITSVDLDQLDSILERNRGRIEYIIGSIHHVGGIPIDFDEDTHKSALALQPGKTIEDQMENFQCSYFEAQFQLLQRFHPEIVGHFDLCRLYLPELRLTDYPRAWKLLERNVSYAIAYGALFEINAAAFRKNWSTAYPAEDVLKARASFAYLPYASLDKQITRLSFNSVENWLSRMIAMVLTQ